MILPELTAIVCLTILGTPSWGAESIAETRKTILLDGT